MTSNNKHELKFVATEYLMEFLFSTYMHKDCFYPKTVFYAKKIDIRARTVIYSIET